MSRHPLGPDLPGMRCIQHLGSGGYSDVYLYERDQPRIKVAVKLLKSEGLGEAQLRQFAAEAEVMAELAEHPYIVAVMGAGTAKDGRPYLEMAYYPPPDLGKRVATKPLTVQDALRTGVQLASAVETAHRSGIIHRDIKPENVLMTTYGIPGLTDFGIAGRGDRAEDDEVGVSVPWSPPEVLTGRSNGTVASDVYSLAATIWNLIVGRSPFSVSGDNGKSAMFRRILHSRPPATGVAEVPASLDRLLQQAMAKDPAQRPQSALELARHLRRIEQELGFTPTDIVVHETEAAPAPAPVVHAPVPEQVDDGPTVLRPRTPTPLVEEHLDDGVTIMRPRRASAPEPAATYVPPRVTEAVPAVDEPAASTRGRVVALVLLLVAAVAGGLFLVSRGADHEQPTAMPTSTTTEDLGNVAGVDPVVAPRVATQRSPRAGDPTSVDVSFSARRERKDDRLRWELMTSPGVYAAYPAGNDKQRISLLVVAPGRACVRLFVRRGGQISDPSEACATVS